jgi:LacI family transcriptional regulator, gluconate utilization system Gnt-I transcriptional repressor
MNKVLSINELTVGETETAPIRLEEVAAAAGVSTITVSRCINRPSRVSRDTREHVLAVAGRMGYIPNRLASSLVSSRTRVIGAVVPTLANPIHAEALQAATDALGGAGYQLLLAHTGYSEQHELEAVRTFLGHRVDAILVTGANHTPECDALLRKSGVPVVETFEFTPSPIDMNVGFSNREAGAAITRYLISSGRRRLAFVEHSAVNDSRMDARRDGFVAECSRSAIKEFRVFATPGSPMTAVSADVVDLIVQSMPSVDAIVFAGHQIAAGAVRHAVDKGIDVPGSLAIAGFGDSPVAQWIRPALTTVRFDMAEMGTRAAHLLLGRLAGDPIPARSIDLGFQIVIRDSA